MLQLVYIIQGGLGCIISRCIDELSLVPTSSYSMNFWFGVACVGIVCAVGMTLEFWHINLSEGGRP